MAPPAPRQYRRYAEPSPATTPVHIPTRDLPPRESLAYGKESFTTRGAHHDRGPKEWQLPTTPRSTPSSVRGSEGSGLVSTSGRTPLSGRGTGRRSPSPPPGGGDGKMRRQRYKEWEDEADARAWYDADEGGMAMDNSVTAPTHGGGGT